MHTFLHLPSKNHPPKKLTVEHNLPPPPPTTSSPPLPPRRPDFATFYTRLRELDTSSTNNPHAVPIPGDISAALRLAAEGYQHMRTGEDVRQDGLLSGMIEVLMRGVEESISMSMGRVEGVGVGEEFLGGEFSFFLFLDD